MVKQKNDNENINEEEQINVSESIEEIGVDDIQESDFGAVGDIPSSSVHKTDGAIQASNPPSRKGADMDALGKPITEPLSSKKMSGSGTKEVVVVPKTNHTFFWGSIKRTFSLVENKPIKVPEVVRNQLRKSGLIHY